METASPEIHAFVKEHIGSSPDEMTLLAGGANNQVYLVRIHHQRYVLKKYFQSTSDPRNRFLAEYSFYSALWPLGVQCMPEPLAWDTQQQLGLFTFIDGKKLTSEEIGAHTVEMAADFIIEINHAIQAKPSIHFPHASESCFSIVNHLDRVEYRLARLAALDTKTDIDAEARTFVDHELQPAWNQVREAVIQHCDHLGLSMDEVISHDQQCLSPSDFGFQNIFRCADNRLYFFDFEYSGWDDITKLCCDFFCQPQIPVSFNLYPDFLERLINALPKITHNLKARFGLLLPVYQIKWCSIMLNEFLHQDLARRQFSLAGLDLAERKAGQLRKARSALKKLCSVR